MSRPTFNVFEPYEGVTVVTMNGAMVDLLDSFIEEVSDVPEKELRAFQQALADPAKSRQIRADKNLVADRRQIAALSNAVVVSWPQETEERPRNGRPRYNRVNRSGVDGTAKPRRPMAS